MTCPFGIGSAGEGDSLSTSEMTAPLSDAALVTSLVASVRFASTLESVWED